MRTTVPHDLGDPLLSTAVLWWNAHVMPLSPRWWDGPWFYPATGSIAFSDPRLGASLIASPLQWLGASPVVAYNVTLLLSFPLCALSAFLLGHYLTGRRDAAAIVGLAYGFNPYRMAHTEHLELLLAYGMPLTLLALHRFVDSRRRIWLGVLSGALLLQGLSSSYYLLFFSVFMALWLVWFVEWRDWRTLASVSAASFLGVSALIPLYLNMWRIHAGYDFRRSTDVDIFSADLTSYVTASPLVALWGWTSSLGQRLTAGVNAGEGQTFLGVVIVILAIAGFAKDARLHRLTADRLSRVSRALWAVSAVVLTIGILAATWGPFDFRAGPIRLTITVFFKTFSIAVLFGVLGVLFSARVRDAYRRRSVLAFYGLATVMLLVCSMGPRPRVLGRQLLYQPPYAWLMKLPGFAESIRVPARFAMPTALALSVAGGLGFARLTNGRRQRAAVVSALALVGIAADTWPSDLPMATIPSPSITDRTIATGASAVIELPAGFVHDSLAMFRAIEHRVPTVNGMSGSLPPHYRALSRALLDGDIAALDAIATAGPLLAAVSLRAAEPDSWAPRLDMLPGARRVGENADWAFYRLEPSTVGTPSCQEPIVRPTSVRSEEGPVPLSVIADNDPSTVWNSRYEPLPRSTTLVIDLGRPVDICGIGLSLGSYAYAYPHEPVIETSLDGNAWTPVHQGPIAADAIRGALKRQTDARIEIPITSVRTQWIRLRRTPLEVAPVWILAELFFRGK